MQINGEATIQAPRDRVWWALNDPSVLARTIPGCLRLEETAPDAYRMTVTAGVAAIKGTYDGEVRISDQQQPASFVLTASGAGAPGTVRTSVQVQLAERGEGGTQITYDADATVGGVLGGVGQRMIAGVARKTAAEFFGNVEDVLTGRAPAGAAPAMSDPAGIAELARPPRGAGRRTFDSGRRPPGIPFPLQTGFLPGAVLGAAAALGGVAVGWLLGRRR